MVTLGDVAAPVQNAIVDGPFGSNLKLVDYVPEGVPVLQGKNITDDTFRWFDVRFISSRKAEELKRSSVRVGDILIVKIGSIGYSAILDDLNGFDHAIIPANLAKVTPNLSKVDLRYLHRWLTSTAANNYLVRAASKTAQPALSLGKIKGLPVPLPPLAEQKRIAGILDAADALRAKRREALAQFDTLLQSTFLDMFGDPVTNPMGWEVRSLGDLAVKKPNNGVFRRNHEYSESLDSGLPVVWVVELFRGNRIDVSESRRLEATQTEIEKYGLLPGDLLFCRSSLKLDGIAYNNVFLGEPEEALFECHLIRVSPKTDVVNPIFLNLQLRSVPMRALLKSKSKTATMTTIDQQALSSVEVVVPPGSLQSRFAAIGESVEHQKASQRAHLAKLDTLFASLQSRAFQGDL